MKPLKVKQCPRCRGLGRIDYSATVDGFQFGRSETCPRCFGRGMVLDLSPSERMRRLRIIQGEKSPVASTDKK